MIEGVIDEFVPNNDCFDDQKYCVCQKEWKGEIMIECDRCSNWFHPKCLNLEGYDEIEMNQHLIFCFECLKYYHKEFDYYPEKDYEKSLKTIETKVTFKFALVEPLDKILSRNTRKSLDFRTACKIKEQK